MGKINENFKPSFLTVFVDLLFGFAGQIRMSKTDFLRWTSWFTVSVWRFGLNGNLFFWSHCKFLSFSSPWRAQRGMQWIIKTLGLLVRSSLCELDGFLIGFLIGSWRLSIYKAASAQGETIFDSENNEREKRGPVENVERREENTKAVFSCVLQLVTIVVYTPKPSP